MASNGWSFLKVLENPVPEIKNLDQSDTVYVHPMVKRSASTLSTKSLEMCTESLGSETGSDVSESGDEFCAISLEERERLRAIQRSKFPNFDRKVRRSDFPPPLTSISGSDGAVRVRHHREGGRLVIKAVSFSNCGTSFQAERTDGRLKLSLLRGCDVNYETEGVEMESYESEGGEIENYESEGDEVESYESEGGEIENYESEGVEVENCEDGDEVESSEEERVETEEEENGKWRCDVDGKRWRMVGTGELKWLTRCKEGGNGNKVFANWGSSWVAIS